MRQPAASPSLRQRMRATIDVVIKLDNDMGAARRLERSAPNLLGAIHERLLTACSMAGTLLSALQTEGLVSVHRISYSLKGHLANDKLHKRFLPS